MSWQSGFPSGLYFEVLNETLPQKETTQTEDLSGIP
jgi:hypothetical protein